MKYWIYSRDKKYFLQVDAERLDNLWPHCPPGQARYQSRKGSKNFEYVFYDINLDECVRKANSYAQEKIDELNRELKQTIGELLTGNERAPKREKIK